MDGTDARISNGTCWSKKNTRASDYFLPCGNAAGPDLNFACCYKGDTCLSSNSCYNPSERVPPVAPTSSFSATHRFSSTRHHLHGGLYRQELQRGRLR